MIIGCETDSGPIHPWVSFLLPLSHNRIRYCIRICVDTRLERVMTNSTVHVIQQTAPVKLIVRGHMPRMPCAICRWNYPYHGDKVKNQLKQKSPRTAVGDHEHTIKVDNVDREIMWRRRIHESIEMRTRRPAINHNQGYELPQYMTNCCPAVTWPRRINLIRLMKWPWWSRKLATLQHIWLW